MKRDIDLGWELIAQDPALRIELKAIEQKRADDLMVAELIDFFARIDRMIQMTAVMVEEDCETGRL